MVRRLVGPGFAVILAVAGNVRFSPGWRTIGALLMQTSKASVSSDLPIASVLVVTTGGYVIVTRLADLTDHCGAMGDPPSSLLGHFRVTPEALD